MQNVHVLFSRSDVNYFYDTIKYSTEMHLSQVEKFLKYLFYAKCSFAFDVEFNLWTNLRIHVLHFANYSHF